MQRLDAVFLQRLDFLPDAVRSDGGGTSAAADDADQFRGSSSEYRSNMPFLPRIFPKQPIMTQSISRVVASHPKIPNFWHITSP